LSHLHLILVFLFFASISQAQDRPYTPAGNDDAENSIPFVVDAEPDQVAESRRTEMAEKPEEDDEAQFVPVTDEDAPVTHDEIAGEKNLTSSRPWKAPDFSKQEGALGYSPTAFAIPKGLEVNVKFWIDIYSKYSTDQGVLHDSDYIDLIYEELDFTPISNRTDINRFQKERLKIKMVKDGKARVVRVLEKLHKTKDPARLTAAERKVWDYFAKVKGKNKFKEANGKGRLRFQLGQKDRVIQGIFFSGRYIEDFEKIFREAGLPIELVRLPFVESSYNVLARSKVGASGLWQIMPYTMKGFAKKDPSVDQRNHPIEATKMAAKILRINYNMLQSWPLALTGYNHGPSGVLRLTKRYKSRELGELVENVQSSKRFGFASRNFYSSFLAILEVTSNATKYLGPVTWSQPLDSVDIKLPIQITYRDLLRWFDLDDLKTQVFNPHITRAARTRARPISKGMVVSIQKAKYDLVMKELESLESLRRAQAAAEAQGRMPSQVQEGPLRYRVQRGDTLASLAEEYGVTAEEIRRLNKFPKNKKIRPGQFIQIP
jgi:membrane-bound lytic murein transglycosylase D